MFDFLRTKKDVIRIIRKRIGITLLTTVLMFGTIFTVSAMSEQTAAGEIVENGLSIAISVDGETLNCVLDSGTVEEALAKAGVTLSAADEVMPPLSTLLQDGDHITVTRVYFMEETVFEEIPFETREESSGSLYRGSTKVATEGSNGKALVAYRVKYVDGEEFSRDEMSRETLVEPIAQVVKVGTKEKATAKKSTTSKKATSSSAKSTATSAPSASVKTVSTLTASKPIQLDANGNPVHYQKVIRGKATAYTASSNAKTSTGKTVRTGYVAVNPDQIPYGTKLYIKTADGSVVYGYAVAADTGGFAKKGHITVDLFFNTKSECIRFGVRDVEIYVL